MSDLQVGDPDVERQQLSGSEEVRASVIGGREEEQQELEEEGSQVGGLNIYEVPIGFDGSATSLLQVLAGCHPNSKATSSHSHSSRRRGASPTEEASHLLADMWQQHPYWSHTSTGPGLIHALFQALRTLVDLNAKSPPPKTPPPDAVAKSRTSPVRQKDRGMMGAEESRTMKSITTRISSPTAKNNRGPVNRASTPGQAKQMRGESNENSSSKHEEEEKAENEGPHCLIPSHVAIWLLDICMEHVLVGPGPSTPGEVEPCEATEQQRGEGGRTTTRPGLGPAFEFSGDVVDAVVKHLLSRS